MAPPSLLCAKRQRRAQAVTTRARFGTITSYYCATCRDFRWCPDPFQSATAQGADAQDVKTTMGLPNIRAAHC